MARKVTSQDVAREAGVSRSAVSLVLNGRAEGAISTANQQAVREAAERLGYRPNRIAQSLRDQTSHTLGVITDSVISGAYGGPMLAGASVRAAESDYVLLVMGSDGRTDRSGEFIDALLARQVDGLLYAAEGMKAWTPPAPFRREPHILLNAFDPDGASTGVVCDEEEGGYQAVRMLLEAGHCEILALTGTLEVEATRRRDAGRERALGEAGVPARALVCGWEIDRGLEVGARVLDSPDRPTGVLCANDRVAAGVLLAAARLGLRVPEDLSVVGYDDDPNVAPQLGLSTIGIPHWQMGERAVDLLLEALGETRLPGGEVVVPTPVLRRGSVAPPSR
ncbi:LacI family DNA-binding transcriptional regulator [Acidipropionibacterium virtanenii]|uniref:Catabolite control protein A n=1 Tax=Acidipropionibacterium virtanenii TaxID=2057246 RepID=A0A344UQ78_9ACTN|nr:LacI family DNA-binding transcriptional regulator [Acidipropionibacterium virtanenii]AXE37426.1 Catabolite control protein A [Acidipropionibacterium virtanenii]